MIDPAAPKHAKRLLTVPEEAKVLQDAVTDVLDRGISLRAVAADLRNRGMLTTTGKPFSATSLRDALLASHVAGPKAVEAADDSTVRNRAAKLADVARKLGAGHRLTVTEATYTLEADLLAERVNAPVLQAAYVSQHPRSQAKWQRIAGAATPARALYQELCADKDFISKGEFAHDVALAVRDGAAFVVLAYLQDAIHASLDDPGEPDAATRTK
jgi:Recombinase